MHVKRGKRFVTESEFSTPLLLTHSERETWSDAMWVNAEFLTEAFLRAESSVSVPVLFSSCFRMSYKGFLISCKRILWVHKQFPSRALVTKKKLLFFSREQSPNTNCYSTLVTGETKTVSISKHIAVGYVCSDITMGPEGNSSIRNCLWVCFKLTSLLMSLRLFLTEKHESRVICTKDIVYLFVAC